MLNIWAVKRHWTGPQQNTGNYTGCTACIQRKSKQTANKAVTRQDLYKYYKGDVINLFGGLFAHQMRRNVLSTDIRGYKEETELLSDGVHQEDSQKSVCGRQVKDERQTQICSESQQPESNKLNQLCVFCPLPWLICFFYGEAQEDEPDKPGLVTIRMTNNGNARIYFILLVLSLVVLYM